VLRGRLWSSLRLSGTQDAIVNASPRWFIARQVRSSSSEHHLEKSWIGAKVMYPPDIEIRTTDESFVFVKLAR